MDKAWAEYVPARDAHYDSHYRREREGRNIAEDWQNLPDSQHAQYVQAAGEDAAAHGVEINHPAYTPGGQGQIEQGPPPGP
jgi:hypothetical protein